MLLREGDFIIETYLNLAYFTVLSTPLLLSFIAMHICPYYSCFVDSDHFEQLFQSLRFSLSFQCHCSSIWKKTIE